MKIPYFEQETAYTCGPAVMRMALAVLGIKKSEKQLVKLLRTNKVIGTWVKNLPRVAEKFKLTYLVARGASVEDLRQLIKWKYVVIVCYYYQPEKISHFAVVHKVDAKNIYLLDPWNGQDHKYSISYFSKIWKKMYRGARAEKRWLFAVKK